MRTCFLFFTVVLAGGFGFAETTPDETVRALVRETRELLKAERLDEAVEKVREAAAVEGANLRTQGTVYNVYADVMRKRGDAVTADKSLLKAYDLLLKARDAAKDDAARQSLVNAAHGVAERLSATKDGKALLESYRAKKAEKKRAARAAEAEVRAARETEKKPHRKTGGASSAAVSAWNPWKKPVAARVLPSKAQKDPEFPWTPNDAEKMLSVPQGSGAAYVEKVFLALEKKFGKRRALNWMEFVLERPTKFDVPRSERQRLWNFYGLHSFYAVDQSRVRQTMVGLRKCGGEATDHFLWRAVPTIRMYDELVKFPQDPDAIVFPKENVWVKNRRTVHADRYGWNPTDATAALQKALDDPKGDIVVLDRKETPWLVTSVRVPSNKTIVFERGVRVHATEAEQRCNSKKTLVEITGNVENIALIGKGDVVIGKYPDAATRDRFVKEEGGTGIYIEAAKHVLVRDLDVKECGCDGITIGGCHAMNRDVYLENLVLEHNARQALSMCCGCDIYMKNVSFLDTRGAQPMAGIDFEPSIQEVEGTHNIYLIDCKFDRNQGGNIVFSESSTYPVTVLFKRCDVGSHDYGAININALCGLYQGNGTDAPSDIVFDACTIKGVSWCPPVTIQNANLFHVTFRDCDIVETAGKPVGVSPFRFLLTREYYNPARGDRTWYQREGSLAFDRTRIRGWKGSEPLSFVDRTGHYSVRGVYGSVTMNGRTLDMAKFRHEASDFRFGDLVPARAGELKYVEDRSVKISDAGTVTFGWNAPWWVGELSYEAFSPKGDGTYASVKITREAASGAAASTGSCFQTTTSDGLFRFAAPTTVYFLVPPGKDEATLKIVEAESVDLLKGRDKVVRTYASQDLKSGFAYVSVRQQAKQQVYGLRVNKGALAFKFFKPYSGLVAVDPLCLPVRAD